MYFKNSNDSDFTFTNNPIIIEKEAIKHFQTIASNPQHTVTYDSLEDLPMEWQHIYDPSSQEIDHCVWSPLICPITLEDLKFALNKSASGKAPGPSSISYEDIKHLNDYPLQILIHIYQKCISLHIIPTAWKQALVFPIPKPHDWNCKLTNTRPITLLETPRKLMVSILSIRLNNILSTHNILQVNNRAGIMGQSTLEPLFHLQHVVEQSSSRHNSQPLWIVLQDLSKAYDRVDVNLLRLVLNRLKIPYDISSFFINLFTDRSNRIIMEDGLSSSYQVLQGIDQGEVVSPLLWNIYYDPLFKRINEDPLLSYKISTKLPKNILHSADDITHNFSCGVVGYLDDTTWFDSSLEQVTAKLTIANDFYQLANIQINKDKYKLLCNQSKPPPSVTITINNQSVDIPITRPRKSERILGVYINAHNSPVPTINKCRQIVADHVITMQKKKITHDHIRYIINKVIIPKLEYLLQHTILSYRQCQHIMAPLKKLYKRHLHLAANTADNIIYNQFYHHIDNLFDILLKSQLNILSALFNTPILRDIVIQKLDTLLHEIWYPTLPHNLNNYSSSWAKPSYLYQSLRLIGLYHFDVSLTIPKQILGGRTPI